MALTAESRCAPSDDRAWKAGVASVDQGRALPGKGTLDGGSQTLPMLYSLPSTDFNSLSDAAVSGGANLSTGADVFRYLQSASAGGPSPRGSKKH